MPNSEACFSVHCCLSTVFVILRKEMGGVKRATRNKYLGRRRNRNLSRSKVSTDDTAGYADVSNADPRPPSCDQSSASKTKLSFFGISLDSKNEHVSTPADIQSDCYFFVQKDVLQYFFDKVLCYSCHSNSVRFDIVRDKSCGFAVKGHLKCTSCGIVIFEEYLCKRVYDSKANRAPFELNMLAAVAFRGIGCGYSAMEDWCGNMNIVHCQNSSAYQKNCERLRVASQETFEKVRDESVEKIFKEYEKLGVLPDDNGVLDIAVSFDGSWQKRGHSSHNGIGSVIDLLTGLPIDFHVLSNFCHKCRYFESIDDVSDIWKERHLENCPKNFEGTANAMEVECAKVLWRRSEANFKLRYSTMLTDGDSKSFDAISEENIYGVDRHIVKEECINHISKRMGTALRKLVETCKAQGRSISGRGQLTKEKIMKIQNYYGRAVKDNANDVELMKKRIFAILFHMSSTNETPKHVHCPPGKKSWCFWQRAEASGKDPGDHKNHETLPVEVGKTLVPIFRRLSDDGLLKRCSRAKTQNANESMHNLIWRYSPKGTYVGRKTLETAVALAVCQFTMGATYRSMLCNILGICEKAPLKAFSHKKNLKRLKYAEKAASKGQKARRKQLKFRTAAKETMLEHKEGITYGAGEFD